MAKNVPTQSPRRTDPGESHYRDWELEQGACVRYGRKTQADRGFATEKEAAVACLYEFTREVVFAMPKDTRFLGTFFSRQPFRYLIDDHPESWDRFLSTPWLELPPQTKRQIVGAIGFSYDAEESDPIHVGSLVLDKLTGVFDRFNKAAAEKQRTLEAAIEQNDKEKCLELVQQPSVLPIGNGMEYVVMLIDYRNKRKAILRQFKDWLDSRDDLFKNHSLELRGGSFFQDRLRDLANWRLHRKLGMKGLDLLGRKDARLEMLGTDTSYSEAKKRALEFTRFLRLVRFQDLKELEIAYQQERRERRE